MIDRSPSGIPVVQRDGAAGYVDRITRSTTPTGPPVQATVGFEVVINLKTAKALGLDLPPMLRVRADDGIEWNSAD